MRRCGVRGSGRCAGLAVRVGVGLVKWGYRSVVLGRCRVKMWGLENMEVSRCSVGLK